MKKIAIVLAFIASSCPSFASQSAQDAVSALYAPYNPPANCSLCHGPDRDATLNPYALDFGIAKADSLIDEQALRQIEQLDSDGDGAENLLEIVAGTRPGDPRSIPSLATASSTWSVIKNLYR